MRRLARCDDFDWSRLTRNLRARRLLPTLGPRIVELVDGHGNRDFAAAVAEAVAATRRQAGYLQLVSRQAAAALADVGIASAPLKGPFLGERLHGDLGRRLASDIDLLVAPERLHAAVAIVRELGYGAPADRVDAEGLPPLHFLLVHADGRLPPVELHWRIHPYERRFAHERLLPRGAPGEDGWRPAPGDELLSLLLFYARDGFVDLRLAADVSAWWDVRGGELEQGALGASVRAYPALSRVARAAAVVAERVVGLPAAHVLGEAPRLGARGRVAARMANPNPNAGQAQLYAEVGLVDGLLAEPGGFRAFVRRRVLPPREFLDELDRRAPKRRSRSSLPRAAGILGRYAVTVTRLALTRDPTRI